MENLETPVLTSKTVFFVPKIGGFDPNLFPNFFSQNFCEFENNEFFQKISELQKSNISETRKNEKFRKICLLQGLYFRLKLLVLVFANSEGNLGFDFTIMFTRIFNESKSQKCKNSVKLSVSFGAFGIRAQFHQRSTYSFYNRRSQKHRNSVKLSVSFYAFLQAQKLLVE